MARFVRLLGACIAKHFGSKASLDNPCLATRVRCSAFPMSLAQCRQTLEEMGFDEGVVLQALQQAASEVNMESVIDTALAIGMGQTAVRVSGQAAIDGQESSSNGSSPSPWALVPVAQEEEEEEECTSAAAAAAAATACYRAAVAPKEEAIAATVAPQSSEALEKGIQKETLTSAKTGETTPGSRAPTSQRQPCLHKCGRTRNKSTAYCCIRCPVMHTPQCEGRWKKELRNAGVDIPLPGEETPTTATVATNTSSSCPAASDTSSACPAAPDVTSTGPTSSATSAPKTSKEQSTQTTATRTVQPEWDFTPGSYLVVRTPPEWRHLRGLHVCGAVTLSHRFGPQRLFGNLHERGIFLQIVRSEEECRRLWAETGLPWPPPTW